MVNFNLEKPPGTTIWYKDIQLEYSECHCKGCRYSMVLTGRAFYRVYTGEIERVEIGRTKAGELVAEYKDKYGRTRDYFNTEHVKRR